MPSAKRTLICLTFLSLIPLAVYCADFQDTIWNQTDGLGRKQGHWKKHYPNGELMYKGFFRDDKPAGKMLRFYDDGKLKVEMEFSRDGERAFATMYFRNGQAGAAGRYSGQKRDSIWSYYSYYTGSLSYRESYRMGKKEGPSVTYYSEGPEAEVIFWRNDMKHGSWRQYYEDSGLRLSSAYEMDRLQGPYRVYNRSGVMVLEGYYSDGEMDGDWKYYDGQGSLKYHLRYRDGVCLDSGELEQWAREFMDNVEKDLGKFPEPDYDNFFERIP
jgi:antitoxin component YwqK of YwqJK toxin-antitoxin module